MNEPRMVIADHHRGDELDAEPVAITTDATSVELRLEDGQVLAFDRAELRAAIDDDHAQAA